MNKRFKNNSWFLVIILFAMAIFHFLDKSWLGQNIENFVLDLCLAVIVLGALFFFVVWIYVKFKSGPEPSSVSKLSSSGGKRDE